MRSCQSIPPPTLTSGRFARLVADLPPSTWAETRRRIEVVERYLSNYSRSLAETEAAAKELGISRRGFSTLVGAYRISRSVKRTEDLRGVPVKQSERTEQIIREIDHQLGPGARQAEVRRKVVERCLAEGLEPPSKSVLRTRRGTTPVRPDVNAALRRDSDVVLDGAPLGFGLKLGNSAKPARLSAVLDARTGRILSFNVSAGPIQDAEWADLTDTGLVELPAKAVVIATRGATIGELTARRLSLSGMIFDIDQSRHLAQGVALRATFGLLIGRVPILEFEPQSPPPEAQSISLDDARSIVSLLVERRNAALQS